MHLLTPPEVTAIYTVWSDLLELVSTVLVHSLGAAAVQPNPDTLSHCASQL